MPDTSKGPDDNKKKCDGRDGCGDSGGDDDSVVLLLYCGRGGSHSSKII